MLNDPDETLEAMRREALDVDLDVLLRETDDAVIERLEPGTVALCREVLDAMRPAVDKSWLAIVGPVIESGYSVEAAVHAYFDGMRHLTAVECERAIWLDAELKLAMRERAKAERRPLGRAMASAVRAYLNRNAGMI